MARTAVSRRRTSVLDHCICGAAARPVQRVCETERKSGKINDAGAGIYAGNASGVTSGGKGVKCHLPVRSSGTFRSKP